MRVRYALLVCTAVAFAPAACASPSADRRSAPNAGKKPNAATSPRLQYEWALHFTFHPLGTTPRGDASTIAPADAASRRAYYHLLGAPDLVVGERCGISGDMRELWLDLSELVRTRQVAAIWDLTARASTREGRVAGVIGLVKLHAASPRNAEAMLRGIFGTITVCEGCLFYKNAPPLFATGLFDVSMDGEAWYDDSRGLLCSNNARL
jgi:hypothetical protein